MMKYILFGGFVVLTMASCNSNGNSGFENKKADHYAEDEELIYRGEQITEEDAITTTELVQAMAGETSMEVKVKADVTGVCKKKGCWMTVDMPDGSTMRVTFKNYGFFMPLDCEGKTAIMEGVASYDTVSVDVLRHYAEDAGKSDEEIEAITEPEVALAFEATGVILK